MNVKCSLQIFFSGIERSNKKQNMQARRAIT